MLLALQLLYCYPVPGIIRQHVEILVGILFSMSARQEGETTAAAGVPVWEHFTAMRAATTATGSFDGVG